MFSCTIPSRNWHKFNCEQFSACWDTWTRTRTRATKKRTGKKYGDIRKQEVAENTKFVSYTGTLNKTAKTDLNIFMIGKFLVDRYKYQKRYKYERKKIERHLKKTWKIIFEKKINAYTFYKIMFFFVQYITCKKGYKYFKGIGWT